MIARRRPACLALIAGVLCACTPNAAYRTRVSPIGGECVGTTTSCPDQAWQRLEPVKEIGIPTQPVSLAFIEFDDQGALRRPDLVEAVMARVRAEGATHPLLLVVFAHGWKHNASSSDSNVVDFSHLLQRIAVEDEKACAGQKCEGRRVVGVYLGWRGLSTSVEPFKEMSFWTRKRRAHRVGTDGAMEVLAKLKKLDPPAKEGRMIIVGHSFGGALVYTALQQALMRDTVFLASGSIARNSADLIVLVNPAFEAQRFAALRQRADGMCHARTQRPILVAFTSRNDTATGRAFPLGRSLGTLFQRYSSDEQGRANRTAIGHYEPFTTHDLDLVPPASSDPDDPLQLSSFAEYKAAWKAYQAGTQDTWPLGGMTLSRREPMRNEAQRHNPYYIVSVDPGIISSHNSIWGLRFSQFLYRFLAVQAKPVRSAPDIAESIDERCGAVAEVED